MESVALIINVKTASVIGAFSTLQLAKEALEHVYRVADLSDRLKLRQRNPNFSGDGYNGYVLGEIVFTIRDMNVHDKPRINL